MSHEGGDVGSNFCCCTLMVVVGAACRQWQERGEGGLKKTVKTIGQWNCSEAYFNSEKREDDEGGEDRSSATRVQERLGVPFNSVEHINEATSRFPTRKSLRQYQRIEFSHP